MITNTKPNIDSHLESNPQKLDIFVYQAEDANLIKKFKDMRNDYLFRDLLIDIPKNLDFLDSKAEMIVATDQYKNLIGGCRILKSTMINGVSDLILSQENPATDSLYTKFLATIDARKNLQLSELSNLFIVTNYRHYSKEIMRQLFTYSVEKLQNEANYCFWVTESIRSRLYRIVFSKININIHTSYDYDWKIFDNYKTYVNYVKFF